MSLIQKALKKSAEDQESPPPVPPGLGERSKGGGSLSNKQIGLIVVLLFCLVGVLVYSLYPYLWKPGKKTAPSPQTVVKKEALPGTKLPGDKEKAPTAPVSPSLIAQAGPQDQSQVIKKSLSPSPVAEKKSKKKVTPEGADLAPLTKIPEIRKSLEPERNSRTIPSLSAGFKKMNKAAKQAPKERSTNASESAKSPAGGDDKGSMEVIRLFNEAVRDQKRGLWDQAVQGYQEVLLLRPNHPEAYNNLGLIYQEQKQFSKALEMFQKALSLNPHYTKGYNNLGLFYLSQGKWDEASTQFRKALDLDPDFIPAYINLSAVYKNQGRLDLARKTLYQALEKDGNNLEAQYNLGLLWENEGVPTKAVEHYQKFVSRAYGPYSGLADDLRKKWPELK